MPRRPARPVSVTLACSMTWVFAGLTLLFLALLVLTLVTQQSQLVDELQRNPEVASRGYTSRDLISFLWLAATVGIVWSLSAIALAVLAFRRVQLGRVGLVVSAAVSAVVGVLSLVGIVHAVAALTTAAQPGQYERMSIERHRGGEQGAGERVMLGDIQYSRPS